MQENSTAEVEEHLRRRFDNRIEDMHLVRKEDLKQVWHC